MFTAHGADRSDDMGRACARACAFIFARAKFDFETPSQGVFFRNVTTFCSVPICGSRAGFYG